MPGKGRTQFAQDRDRIRYRFHVYVVSPEEASFIWSGDSEEHGRHLVEIFESAPRYSNPLTVTDATPDFSAKSSRVQPRSARAARNCAGVSIPM